MRKYYDTELQELNNELVEMGALIENAINHSVNALKDKDVAEAEMVNELEAKINHKEKDIEKWLWLWNKIIINAPEKNCTKVGNLNLWKDLPSNKSLFTSNGKGLPIGNLSS